MTRTMRSVQFDLFVAFSTISRTGVVSALRDARNQLERRAFVDLNALRASTARQIPNHISASRGNDPEEIIR